MRRRSRINEIRAQPQKGSEKPDPRKKKKKKNQRRKKIGNDLSRQRVSRGLGMILLL